MNIFIDKETLLRVDINQPYKDFSRLDTPEIREAARVIELSVTLPQYDSEEVIFNELNHPPYFALTPRDPEQVAASRLVRATEARRVAYLNEADPLFFKEQRGEVPCGTWLTKITEIKERYPK